MLKRRLDALLLEELGVEPAVPRALAALTSPVSLLYLEQIARRPAPIHILRTRAWAVPAHGRILKSLERAQWISLAENGAVKIRAATIDVVRERFDELFLQSGGAHLWAGTSRISRNNAEAPPTDARAVLPIFAVPQRLAVLLSVADGGSSNMAVTMRLGVGHSLVSYHVRLLRGASLVTGGGGTSLSINRRVVLEICEWLRLLEVGWPYRPGANGLLTKPPAGWGFDRRQRSSVAPRHRDVLDPDGSIGLR